MRNTSVWVTKRKGKRGTRYLVRWIEPCSGSNRGKTFKRLEDARAYEAKLRQDIKYNDYHAPLKISYDEWVQKHLADMGSSPDVDIAVKTIAGHKEALAALGRACKPNSPLDITPKMMRTFRLVLLDKGLSVHTINKHIRVVRSALSYAVRAEIIPSNKLLGPHRLCLRAENKVPRILEVGEIIALMNVSTDLRHRTAVSLAYYHGLRRGEFCYLQWQDIDFEECRLDIANRQEARTKTRKSRTIALRRESAGLLAELYQGRVNEYVFANPGDFYLSCDKWFKRLVKSAGLDHCTLHDLRKTCNTLMKDAGVSQEAAMQVLGHSSAYVNQQYYTGILTEQQRTAVDSLPTVG